MVQGNPDGDLNHSHPHGMICLPVRAGEETRICGVCSTRFVLRSHYPFQIWCSGRCRTAASRGRKTAATRAHKRCEQCGELIIWRPRQQPFKRFCCKKCQHRHRREVLRQAEIRRTGVNKWSPHCLGCKKPIKRPRWKWCSIECAQHAWLRANPLRARSHWREYDRSHRTERAATARARRQQKKAEKMARRQRLAALFKAGRA